MQSKNLASLELIDSLQLKKIEGQQPTVTNLRDLMITNSDIMNMSVLSSTVELSNLIELKL